MKALSTPEPQTKSIRGTNEASRKLFYVTEAAWWKCRLLSVAHANASGPDVIQLLDFRTTLHMSKMDVSSLHMSNMDVSPVSKNKNLIIVS